MSVKGCHGLPKIDEAGVRYGQLIVESYAGRNLRGMALWNCRCDCGTEKVICVGSLRSGASRSCGCGLSHNFKDMSQQRFGRLIALDFAGMKNGIATWNCRCDCGKECVVLGSNLRRGGTRSCGCLNAARTHGLSGTPEHGVWKKMKQRCENKSHHKYPIYGGRGIIVCERWQKFENFLADMGTRPSKNMQIDRIKTDGNYEPGNCRWTTCKKNNRNRRDNRILEVNGEKHCLAEWAEIKGLKTGTLWMRLNKGWTEQRAVMTPLIKKGSP